MSEWIKQTFGELVDFHDHQRIPLSSKVRATRKGQYPYYGAQEIVDYIDDYIFDGEYVLIAEDGANLITRNKPIATLAKGKFWVNNHAHIIRNKPHADLRFLLYLLNAHDVSGYITGSAQPKLSQERLASIPFSVPQNRAYQKKVADILTALDDKIELNRRLNDNLEAMAQALYDYWFVQFDFPDENGKPYKSSGGKMVWNDRLKREIPEGWSAQPLFDVASVLYGYPFKTELFTENEKDLPVIRIRDILDNTFSAYSSEPIHGKYLTQKGDLLIGMDGNFHLNYWHRDGDGVNQRVVRIRSCTSTLSNIQLKLELAPYIKMREMNVTRSTVGHLGDKDFKERYIVVAPETSTFNPAKALNALLERMTSLVAETQKLTKQRDFLLPLLMNGQVQVKPQGELNYRLADD